MDNSTSTGAIWAWVFAILFIITLLYAWHEHSVASSATAAAVAAASNTTEQPMIPADTSTTTSY